MKVWTLLDPTHKIFIQDIYSFSGLAGLKFTAYIRGFCQKVIVITSI